MSDNVANWDKSIEVFSQISEKEPQAAFAVLTRLLQNERAYTQRVTYHPVDTFSPLDHDISNSFHPAIFGVNQAQEDFLQMNFLTVKTTGLVILQPSRDSPINHANSKARTSHAVEAILR